MKKYFRQPLTRREFIRIGGKGAGLLAFSQYAPSFLAQTVKTGVPSPDRDNTILVLIQLAGGNDGLNTVIPYQDDRYYKLRPNLAIQKDALVPLESGIAFNKACSPISALHKDGKLSIIQNIGYPNPNRSHFRSSEIWETASSSDEFLSTGWFGRYLDNNCSGTPLDDMPSAIHLTNEVPQTFFSDRHHNIFGVSGSRFLRNRRQENDLLEDMASMNYGSNNAGFLQQTLMDTISTQKRVADIIERYKTGVNYPPNPLAQSLKHTAALIKSGSHTRMYFHSQSGYDTHVNQLQAHTNLLTQLSEALAAFQQDLEANNLDKQVLTMTFSEFGRRPAENNGKGTDHGTAAPLFVMGSNIRNTIVGSSPDLNVGTREDLSYAIDFRRIYATILDKWLGCKHSEILGSQFEHLDFI